MKRTAMISTLALVFALAVTVAPMVLAGDASYDCDKPAQECLNAKAAKLAKHGWLGIHTEKNEKTGRYVVAEVTGDSPAEVAGFKAGDELVAMNGVELSQKNKEAIWKVKKSMTVGSQITYTVRRAGYKKQIEATLAKVPGQVLAQWVGEHMLDHHVTSTIAQAD